MGKKQKAVAAKKATKQLTLTDRLRWLARWVGAPVLIYFVFFCFFTWPWITHFNGWYFTDAGDGLQNVWNMWWIEKAITDLGQHPWHTEVLHAPWGVSLLGQTLNPFNGFVGIALINIFSMSLVQAFNVMVIFSFVFGGLSMFWLCYYFSKSYVASLIGGFIFTFSSYHFAHAVGHMQLVSLEFIPLFVLLWWMLLKKPSYPLAIGTSLTLFLVLFCDYYYFLYSIMLAVLSLIYLYWRKELPNLKARSTYLPYATFIGVCLLTVLPLPLALLMMNSNDPLNGAHNPRVFSTDIFMPFINGGFWYFHSLTDWYWKHVQGYMAETSSYLTISLITVFVIGWFKRKKLNPAYYFWLFTAFFFGIMSIGPRAHYGSNYLDSIPMPYVILEKIVPGFKLSGMPVRMLLITIFSMAIIAAMVLAKVNITRWKGRALLALFVIIYSFEVFPSTLPLTPRDYPSYVYVLQKLPDGQVLDNAAKSSSEQLLNQTKHEKEMPLGYISRTPYDLESKEAPLVAALMREQYNDVCRKYELRYITTPASRPLKTNFPIIYQDNKVKIYDLKNSPNC